MTIQNMDSFRDAFPEQSVSGSYKSDFYASFMYKSHLYTIEKISLILYPIRWGVSRLGWKKVKSEIWLAIQTRLGTGGTVIKTVQW